MTPDELREQVERAIRAQAILDDTLVKEAFDTLRQTLIDTWLTAPTSARELQSDCHKMMRLLGNFRQFFVDVLNSGDIAKEQLRQLAEEAEFERLNNGINKGFS